MGYDQEEKKPLSKGCLFAVAMLALALGLVVWSFTVVGQNFSDFEKSHPFVKDLSAQSEKKTDTPIPMRGHYKGWQKYLRFPPKTHEMSDQSFRNAVAPFREKALALANEIQEVGFDRDWVEGVDHLNDAQPEWLNFSTLGRSASFEFCQNLTRCFGSLGRLLWLEDQKEQALRVYLGAFSIPSQMLSTQKHNHGMLLLDAMNGIALIREATLPLLDLGKVTNWHLELFGSAFRERFEEIHKLFPLVAEGMKLGRVVVASFFHAINQMASQQSGEAVSFHDVDAVRSRSDYYLPSHETLTMPYALAKDELSLHEERYEELASDSTWEHAKSVSCPLYAIERMMQHTAAKELRGSRKRECECIALFRGCYLAFAIAAHHAKHGAYPKDLDELHAEIKATMRIDPFTGKDLNYSSDQNSFRLWSTGDGEAISIVPWNRK